MMFTYDQIDMEIDELHKLATKQKDEGEMLKAINTLEQAVNLMNKSKIEYTAERYLRLPLFLQQAGLFENAIEVLNDYKSPFSDDPFFMCVIEDKTRLIYQREKKYIDAIPYGISSYMYSLLRQRLNLLDMKKHRDKRAKQVNEELKFQLSRIYYEGSVIKPLLKKANLTDKNEELTILVENFLRKFPKVDIGKLKKEIIEILL